jgi:hypothetical protein
MRQPRVDQGLLQPLGHQQDLLRIADVVWQRQVTREGGVHVKRRLGRKLVFQHAPVVEPVALVEASKVMQHRCARHTTITPDQEFGARGFSLRQYRKKQCNPSASLIEASEIRKHRRAGYSALHCV